MAWTTMHFAVGMGCAGLAATGLCLTFKRGWRWIPAAMTAGGVWAVIPDMPRVLREDVPFTSEAIRAFSQTLETYLHEWGNLFFFHKVLDDQPREYALLGLTLILIFYNAAILLLMVMESRQRHHILNRAHRNHAQFRLRRQQETETSDAEDHPAVIGRIRASHFTRSGSLPQ